MEISREGDALQLKIALSRHFVVTLFSTLALLMITSPSWQTARILVRRLLA
jgi:hypothetical protein